MTATYLDSCVVINASEESALGDRLRARISGAGSARFVVSPLVRLEALVRPLRSGDADLLARRRQILDNCESAPISERCYELATHIRARHGLDTADALHVAAASEADCDELWTSDRRLLSAAPGFAIDVLRGA